MPLTRMVWAPDFEPQRPAALRVQSPTRTLGLPSKRPVSETIRNLDVHAGPQSLTFTTCAKPTQPANNKNFRWSFWPSISQSSRANQNRRQQREPD